MNNQCGAMLGDVHAVDISGVRVRICGNSNAFEPTINGEYAKVGLS